ncbi:hypothetical protein HCA63_06905 [Listeria booriae]|uniref:hypothetical protein n=1 Tax=Listeria booriae TaxID=1552123 RepID=UPI00162954AC|nr:hypothetical protein [Listeria booriae]MBC1888078.1 hypothetical protein [Listeria booriae]
MIINKLIILDYENEKANEFIFSEKVNIITSDKTTTGKSSLIKSLYYALGFEIKQFPHGWNFETMRFRVDISIEEKSYFIIRSKALFYISELDEPLNLKEFSNWFQEKLNIKMKLKLQQSSENELSDVYSTEVLAPFYLDQDKSWNGYLFKKSSDSLGRYSSIPKDILEYVLGISSQEILERENEKNINSKLRNQIIAKIDVLNSLQKDYLQKTKIVASSSYDIDQLKNVFSSNLNQLSRISRDISMYKKELFGKKNKLDLNSQDNTELEKIMVVNKKTYKDVALECVHCHSRLTLEQSLTRLKLKNNLFEIENLYNTNKKENEKLQQEINDLREKMLESDVYYKSLNKKKKDLEEIITLQEYIDLESKRLANDEFLVKLDDLNIEKDRYDSVIKDLRADIASLKRDQETRKIKINDRYTKILSDINLRFNSSILDNYSFFDFREIKGSGMDNNKMMLSLYITYMRLVSEFGIYSLPFGIDSFIKNEVDKDIVKVTFKEVEKYFLSMPNQIFFVTIYENLSYLEKINEYEVIKLSKPILLSDKYKELLEYVSK